MKMLKIFATAMLVVAFASCNSDAEVIEEVNAKAEAKAKARSSVNYGLLPGVNNSTGQWLVSDLSNWFSGTYNLFGSGAVPTNYQMSRYNGTRSRYAMGGRVFNGSLYILNNNLQGGQRGILKANRSGNGIVRAGFIATGGGAFGQQAEVNFTLFDANTGYFTDNQNKPGIITPFNPSTMVKGTDVNLTSQVATKLSSTYRASFNNASIKSIGEKMLIRRGNKLYADVTFGNSRNRLKQIEQSVKRAFVAVINVNGSNLSVAKVLVSSQVTSNIGLFNDHPLVNIDVDTKDIYFATVGDMMQNKAPNVNTSIIFKINANDRLSKVVDYQEINTGIDANGKPANFRGEFNTMYVHNGVVYTKLAKGHVKYANNKKDHIGDYRSNVWEYHTISGGSKTKLNIPADNFYAYQQPQLIKTNGSKGIYVIVNNTKNVFPYGVSSGIYRITPGTGSATRVSLVRHGGLGWGVIHPNKIASIVKF